MAQRKNAVWDINYIVYNTFMKLAHDHSDKIVFLNAAVDGLASESQFVTEKLESFLCSTTLAPVITDVNHNMKSMRYQLIGGSACVTCGTVLINPGLLKAAGVAEGLFRVSDWASNKLVLEIASENTINKLHDLYNTMVGNISENAAMSFAALSISLCLMRVHLYCANAKGLSATTRILGLWVSMIWFTSLDGISIITKRNLVYATVGLVFLISRNDVYHP